MNISQILKALEWNTGAFPKQAVEAVIANREEISPHLLRILDDAIDRSQELAREAPDGRYFAHLYAMYLLAQFRDTRAYPLVVKFCRLDEETLDCLAGDFVTEDLCRVLASVCGGDTGLIENLIEDSNVYEYASSAALRSLVVLVVEGDKSRDEVMTYFKSLFESKLERCHSHVWDELVAEATSIHPAEVHDYILQAYEEGIVNPGFISPKNVQRALNRSKSAVLEELVRYEQGYIDDVVADMQWWACFKPLTDQ